MLLQHSTSEGRVLGRIINLAKAESPSSTISKDRVEVQVGLGRNPRRIEIGFGRLFFRRGRGWSASFRHIEVWSVLQPPKTQPLTFEVPLKPCAGLVRGDGYLDGAILAPAAKIDLEGGLDVWVMLLAPAPEPAAIEPTKRVLLVSDRDTSAQATLEARDGRLACSISAYGSGLRNARLEIKRTLETGLSAQHGFETVTVSEEVVRVGSGETKQALWIPVRGPPEPVTVLARSMPSAGAVIRILNELGCRAKNRTLLGPKLDRRYHVIGDGEPTRRWARLIADRPLRRGPSDEAEIKIRWGEARYNQ
jgi:hypothetical protein